ncbi:MAG: cytochrome P450 [Acidimicrobiales bacterium]
MTPTTAGTDLIFEPAAYTDGPPHDRFTWLRANDPVHRAVTPDGTECWAITRHADVVDVSRRTEVFSAAEAGVVLQDLEGDSLASMRKMLLAMDPPTHGLIRRQVSGEFRARVIAGLEPRIRAICATIIDAGLERSADAGEVDFVHDVCSLLPSQILGELMGLPAADWPKLHAMAERNSGGQDPDINPDPADERSASIEMALYAMAFAADRRQMAEQPADLTTVILATEVDGAPMTDPDFGAFFVQLVTAGNDTTRTMLSSGLDVLLDHPDQLAMLRADPGAIPGAVEEILRHANPLHYFRRTAIADTRVGETPIAAGEKLAMMYTSANRDEDVFTDPHTFDITRDPNPHLSFGIAEHFCLGVHLARLEGRVFFEELLSRCGSIERTGTTARQHSNLNNSLKRLPVCLHPSA